MTGTEETRGHPRPGSKRSREEKKPEIRSGDK